MPDSSSNLRLLLRNILISLLLYATTAQNCDNIGTVYVKSTGSSDPCCGIVSFPCASMSSALNRVSDGGYVYLYPGVHYVGEEQISLSGRSVSVLALSSSSTILDCSQSSCLEAICSSSGCSAVDLTLKGFLVRNGRTAIGNGGCLRVENQNLKLMNMTFQNCHASTTGGAISLVRAKATLSDVSIVSSSVTGSGRGGGAICLLESNLSADGLTVTNCTANEGGGGGIYASDSWLYLSQGSKFEHCHASYGGAMLTESSEVQSNLTVFQNNSALNYGGCWVDHESDVAIVVNTFDSCSAGGGDSPAGGAFYGNSSISFRMESSSVVDCFSSSDGGGIFLFDVANSVIRDSRFEANYAKSSGCAMYVDSSTLNISNTKFLVNVMTEKYTQGAGIYASSSFLSITGSNFAGNGLQDVEYAQYQVGAAIFFQGFGFPSSLEIRETAFSNNTAQTGGAVYTLVVGETSSSFPMMIDSCQFSGNRATQVGGALAILSSLAVTNSSFTSNAADVNGGAISVQTSKNNVTLSTCTFVDNVAGANGGAVDVPTNGQSYLQVLRSIFERNRAPVGFGGALYIGGKNARFISSQFNRNTAGIGGGALYIDGGAVAGAAVSAQGYFFNCSFSANSAPLGGGSIYGVSSSVSTFNKSSFAGCSSNLGGAIFLSQLSHTIIDSCTCINNSASYGGGCLLLQDQATAVVTNSMILDNVAASEGGGAKLTGSTNLQLIRSRLESNSASTGGAIWSEVLATMVSEGSNFTANKATFLGGAIYQTHNSLSNISVTRFDRNVAVHGSAIHVEAMSQIVAARSVWRSNIGSAILLKGSASVSLSTCTFHNNSALEDENGGAVWASDNSVLHVSRASSFVDNKASIGGAIFADVHSSVSLNSTTFESNSAISGGAIAVSGFVSTVVSKSNFTSNFAAFSGGALFLDGPTGGSIASSLFLKNQAGREGSAIYLKRSHGYSNSNSTLFCRDLSFNGSLSPDGAGNAYYDASYDPKQRVSCINCSQATLADRLGSVPTYFRYLWPGQVDSEFGTEFQVFASSGDPIDFLQIMVLDGYGAQIMSDSSSVASVTPSPRISGLLTGTSRSGMITLPSIFVSVSSQDISEISLNVTMYSPSNAYPPIVRTLHVAFCQPGYFYSKDTYSCQICPIGQWCAGGQPTEYCPDGSYSFQPGASSPANCSYCEGGIDCSKGNSTILEGFWLDPDSLPLRPAVYGCDQSRGCSGFQYLGEIVNQCKAGYQDRVCSACSSGYYGFLSICSRCTPLYKSTFVFASLVIIAVWLLLNWLTSMSAGANIVMVETQFLAILGAYNLNYFGETWIASVFQGINVSLFYPDFLGPECMSGSYTFVQRWVFTAVLPLAGILFYLLLFVMESFRGYIAERNPSLEWLALGLGKGPGERRRAVLRSILNLLDLLYLSVTVRCFQTFHWQHYDKKVLSADPTVLWLSAPHLSIFPFAIAYTALYVVGLPLLYTWLILDGHAKGLLHEKEYLEKYGILYERYEAEMCWWYVPMTWGRRILFAAILVFWSAHPDLQAYMSFLVILLVGLFHYFMQPHKATALDLLLGLLLLGQYLYLLAGTANSYMTSYVAGQPSQGVAGAALLLYMAASLLIILLTLHQLWVRFWVRQWAATNGDDDTHVDGDRKKQFSTALLFATNPKPVEAQELDVNSNMASGDRLAPLEEITEWFNPHVLKAFLEYANVSELNLLQMVRVTYSYHMPSREDVRQAGIILKCLPKSLRFSFINELLIDMEMEKVTPCLITTSILSDRSSSTFRTSPHSGSTTLSIEKLHSATVSATATATLQKVYGFQRIREIRSLTEAAASDKKKAGETLRLLLNPRYVEIITAWLLFDELEGRMALKELLSKFNQWLLVLPNEFSTYSKLTGQEKRAGSLENSLRRRWRHLSLKLAL